ncbi:MerR family transcriptional regulator [Streptomyces sp. 3N207]
MRIGELARRTGVNTRLLRYYEEQDLLHPQRSSNTYREYAECAVERVHQIRGLLDCGLPTRLIRVLLQHVQGPHGDLPPCPDAETANLLRQELGHLETRIDRLVRSRDEIRCYLGRVT